MELRLTEWRRIAFALCAGYPAIYLACLAKLVLTARLLLGRWPRPSLDDPKRVHALVSALHQQQLVLLLLWPLAIMASPWLGASLYARGERRLVLWLGALALPCWVAFFAYPQWDPGRFCEWLMD